MTSTVPTLDRVDVPAADSRRRRRGRLLVLIGVVLAVAIVAFHAGGGWYFANQIRSDALTVDNAPDSLTYDVELVAVGEATVEYRLAGSDNLHLEDDGIFGMAWETGFIVVGDILATTDETVTRSIVEYPDLPRFSTVEPTPGTMVDLIGAVWPSDPFIAFGLDFEEVTYTSAIGELGAWYVPADSDDWVIFVHGKSAPRYEALRMLQPVNAAGYQALVIRYRNDPSMAEDPSGYYRYGLTEWRDLDGAVTYARSRGADRIALVGYSMGGGIVAEFILESDQAGAVDAVVLDAPMLDFGATVDAAAEDERLPLVGLPVPDTLVSAAKRLAAWRFGVDWATLDYTERADEFATPFLIFHGMDDDRVPIGVSEDLVDARPDLVSLIRVTDAGHAMSWNVGPERYESAVTGFLAEHLGD